MLTIRILTLSIEPGTCQACHVTPPEIRTDQSDYDLEMGLGADPVLHSVALSSLQVLASFSAC